MDVLPLVVNARHLGKPSVGVEGKIANAESLNVLFGWLESDWIIQLCYLQLPRELVALIGVGLVGNLS